MVIRLFACYALKAASDSGADLTFILLTLFTFSDPLQVLGSRVLREDLYLEVHIRSTTNERTS